MTIDNTVIGDPQEKCYLPTWFFQITKIRDFIKENSADLYIHDFDNLTSREIFELVVKANQIDEEFDSKFLYLPQLENEVWQRHYLTLDETINDFEICYYITNNEIKFIIKKWKPEEPDEERSEFLLKSVDVNNFFSTLDETIDFLEKTYPYLANHKNQK